MHRSRHAAAIAIACGLAIGRLYARTGCADEPLCPDGHVPTGDFPQCVCGVEPPPRRPEPRAPEPGPPSPPAPAPGPDESPRQPLRCETHFACVDGQQVAFGEWPQCTCANLETPIPPGGAGPRDPGIPPGLGEVDTCKAFFTCPTKFEMTVWNGKCVCREEMLPPPER